MTLSTLHIQDKGNKYKPFPIDLVEALNILNPDRILSTIPSHLHKQANNKEQMKITTTSSTQNDREKRGKNKKSVKRNPKFGKANSSRKSSKYVQPLGRTQAYKNELNLNFIPKLRKLDEEIEKDRELQRIMNNLKLTKNDHPKITTSSSKNKELFINSHRRLDFASALIEGHNLTLKQLRDFWSQMPSFLTIQAASLKSKYGVLEKDGTDIDDIAIEIVKKWNQPTTILPKISKTRGLYVVQEET